MRKARFTDSQIMVILKQAESGVPVPDLCREHGMSSASFYKWRAKYGGMDISMMKRLKELGTGRRKPSPQEDIRRGATQIRVTPRGP